MDIFNAIGGTPLVKLNYFSSSEVKIYAKLEGTNPGGSIKDRTAYFMIKEGEKQGKLTKETSILEATSGNTGISLAMIGACKGYKTILVMSENASRAKIKILKFFGAEIVLTKGELGTDGAIEEANRIYNNNPNRYFMPNQYNNFSNVLSHYTTTGPEILSQTNGNIDALVAGVGTSGTITGTGRFLKGRIKDIKVIGVQPLPVHSIQGLKNLNISIKPGIFDSSIIDKTIFVDDESAYQLTRKLALKEGILAGPSSGAALFGALAISKTVIKKGNIVVIFPDRGERYFSTPVFCNNYKGNSYHEYVR
ncbi:MAG TPA: cysteine synthase family protein [Bacteroidetes bacterium]|nr:cysteine synthase family protein [Bacteroidota bacterium]